MHNLKHGDTFKVLPFIVGDSYHPFRSFDSVYIDMTHPGTFAHSLDRFIYDNSNKSYLRKIYNNKITKVYKSFFINILIDGEVKTTKVKNDLIKLLIDDNEPTDIKNNKQIFCTGYGGFMENQFFIIEKEWVKPLIDIESKEAWIKYIKNNQFDLDTFIEKNNIFNKKDVLIKHFGYDVLSEVIINNRNEKLNILLDDN
jgi:hypothetical protein